MNAMLRANVRAPAEQRWVMSPFMVVAMLLALIASLMAGNVFVSVVAAVSAIYLTWDGWRRFRRWASEQ